ncbi:unnamed protein product [Didymodactylos carnosus]|uniref:EF-hand domain-containing protein n=1 Tax=Didymodactylos carnosus TaxID=1234261 RepID=A0A814DNE0_9BILA|nr:unnamed protein product [Didymodactylos carnosus]CAF3733006.1 unnamed protein product [Didymodactylos carnosus]
MGNTSGTYDSLIDETKEQLMQKTGMSSHDLEVWYKEILVSKLSKDQMVSIYKDLSDLDSTRIENCIGTLTNVFDEDHSGTNKFLLSDINEFMRGFILTTKGNLRSKIDYTFRLYDSNADGEISGDEIHKMADAILRILGADEKDEGSKAIISQFLNQFTGGENGIIKKEDFIQTVLRDDGLLMLISPFYGS